MDLIQLKAVNALHKRFALELMTSGENAILNVAVEAGEFHTFLLSYVNSHPATMYAIKNWLTREEFITVNRSTHKVIVHLDKLRSTKEVV